MALRRVHIGNFKGVDEGQWIDIRPITLFIGPNSSGKSSCIHALACLSQSVKISNDSRPLILDDEFASVHLGRFIEVVHSKKYDDAISLGVTLDETDYPLMRDRKIEYLHAQTEAVFHYKCTKRTQEVYLDSARVALGSEVYAVKKTKGKYALRHNGDTILNSPVPPLGLNGDSDTLFYHTEHFERLYGLIGAQRGLITALQNVLYLGPFRQSPLRRYATRGASPTEVGSMGEATVTMLANEVVQTRSRKHLTQVAKWLKRLGLAETLNVARVATSDLFDANVLLSDGQEFPIADLGYGLSQVLPVLTQCSFAPADATLLFEQPELHLHSIAARQLAGVFMETAQTTKGNVLIETHSPELFMQFVSEMREGNLLKENFVAYMVRRIEGRTVLEAIDVDPDTFDVYQRWEQGLTESH